MPVREGPPQPPPPHADGPSPYPAEKARGGRIILRTPLMRAVFFGGLIALVVIGIAMLFLR